MNRLFTAIKPKRTLRMSVQYLKYSKKDFELLDQDKCINRLVYGFPIKRISKNGKQSPEPILFYILEDDPTKLQWLINGKSPLRCRIDLKTVIYITDTVTVFRPKLMEKYEGACLLSIHYGLDEELILLFDDEISKAEWWCGLQHFINLSQKEEKDLETVNTVLAREIFNRADIDGTKSLDKSEVRGMLKGLQIYVKNKEIDSFFEMYDIDKNKRIDIKEFEVFVTELLRKEELLPLFKKCCALHGERRRSEPSMTLLELLKFFQEEQTQSITLATLRKLNTNFEVIPATKPCISFDFFCTLIFSQRNTIFNPEHSYNYQDMKRPLTDYYINSSHNTYLLSNQITGESSVHAYVSALKKGCRCVELDIWTGSNSVPIIYHGHTMTTKIYCEDVIKALKEHAFLTSPYPLILSFEMHCDQKTQKNLVAMLERVLGEMIHVLPDDYEDYDYYPSPETLQGRIIIKGTGKLKSQYQADDGSEGSNNDEQVEEERAKTGPIRSGQKTFFRSVEDLTSLMGAISQNLTKKGKRGVQIKYPDFEQRAKNLKNIEIDYSNQGEEEEEDDDASRYCEDILPIAAYMKNVSNKVKELDLDIFKIRNSKNKSDLNFFERKRPSAAPNQTSNKPKLHVLHANQGDEHAFKQMKTFSTNVRISHRGRTSLDRYEQPYQDQNIDKIKLELGLDSDETDIDVNPSSPHAPSISVSHSAHSSPEHGNGKQGVIAHNLKETTSQRKKRNIETSKPNSEKLSYPNIGKNATKITSFPTWQGIEEKFVAKRKGSVSRESDRKRGSLKPVSCTPMRLPASRDNSVMLKKKKVDKTIPELNRLYAMIGRPMHLKDNRSVWEISSLNEHKILRLYKLEHKSIVDFHKQFLSRIYPLGSRIDSSNYDPTTSWAAGSQIVALNFQKNDEPMLINYAKFIANGGVYSGYVLKPKYMRHDSIRYPEFLSYPADFKKPLKKLTIQIISGQQIRPDDLVVREIIDPYIEVKIKGLEIDEQVNSVYRTHTIKDNGFYPIWARNKDACKFEFQIHAPDFCTLIMTAYHEDVMSKDRLGWYAIEFKNIQTGYRVVPLMNSYLQHIKGSYVFCHITISDM